MTDAPTECLPLYFGIEVTRQCNLRCPHCFTRSSDDNPPGPDTASLQQLLGELVHAGVRRFAFSGGEPLLRRDLEALIEHGRELGAEGFGIVTNGYYAERRRAVALARAGLTVVQVSLDGVDALDHCAVRRCGRQDYYRALSAIRAFREAGITVDVACIIAPRNVERAPEMALLCQSLGVRALRYCSFVPTGRAASAAMRERFRVPPEQMDQFVEFLQELDGLPRPPVRLIVDHGIGPWRKPGRFHCVAGREVAYASCEGDLYPCPSLIHDAFRVGNVFETPVEQLLGAEEMSRVRSIPRNQLQGMCHSCPATECTGGCRGAAYAAAGDVLAEPSYCFFAHDATRRPSGDTAGAPAGTPGQCEPASGATSQGQRRGSTR